MRLPLLLILGLMLAGETFGATPRLVSPGSGFHDQAVEIKPAPSRAGYTLRLATDGSVPDFTNGSPLDDAHRLLLTNTTVLRVAAFKTGETKPAAVETHTYIFPREVAHQTGAGFPTTWGHKEDWTIQADYEMDPKIANHPAYRDDLVPALKALPSVSIVMSREDWFGPEDGIYTHPEAHTDMWERPAAVEMLAPDGGAGFQIHCGVRIQGGWNRKPQECPKHSFRLYFRKKYGAGKLKARLFERPGAEEFDSLTLRGGCNNTWLHWSSEERRRGDYLRDQWMRETYAAMGHPSARGRFVHVYLNGLYWGIYNLTERPDAHFAAANLGGSPADYDARNGKDLLAGDDHVWQEMFRLANAGLANQKSYEALGAWLDLPAFTDYIILNGYGANADWDGDSNWCAARRRTPEGKYTFFVWDGERTLENVADNRLSTDDDQSPMRLFHKLRANAEFRRLFSERVKIHLSGQGALTPEAARARYQRWSDQLDGPIVAESARWGDYRRDVHPYKTGPYKLYTRDDFWRPEIKRLLTDYFPRRTAVVLKQFSKLGLYSPDQGDGR